MKIINGKPMPLWWWAAVGVLTILLINGFGDPPQPAYVEPVVEYPMPTPSEILQEVELAPYVWEPHEDTIAEDFTWPVPEQDTLSHPMTR